jgi:hypothetical protein
MKPLQIAVGLLATVAFCSLYAQTIDARANIPFEFRVGEKLMPAGEYLIHHDAGLLTLQGRGGSHAGAVVITYPTDRPTDLQPEKSVVQFNRYGDVYYLGKISIRGSDIARAVMRTPREKELARRSSPGQRTIAFESK